MSQHPSLKVSSTGTEQRSVLKRFEKVKTLQEKKLWNEGTSIFHLPKVKTVRVKIKKIAEAAPKEGIAAGVPAAPVAGASTVSSAKKGAAASATTSAAKPK
jgi:small basic protein (TIGR04137 family)